MYVQRAKTRRAFRHSLGSKIGWSSKRHSSLKRRTIAQLHARARERDMDTRHGAASQLVNQLHLLPTSIVIATAVITTVRRDRPLVARTQIQRGCPYVYIHCAIRKRATRARKTTLRDDSTESSSHGFSVASKPVIVRKVTRQIAVVECVLEETRRIHASRTTLGLGLALRPSLSLS